MCCTVTLFNAGVRPPVGVREGSGGRLEFDDLGGGRGFCFSHAERQDVQLGGHGPSGKGAGGERGL